MSGAPAPRLYDDLVSLWPIVSPPENYEEEVATFVRRFRRHGVADGARVLHLGCGGGSIDWHLKRHYAVTGVDLSPGMLEHARRLNPEAAYHVGDMRTHRLGESFDAVLVHDAISYMTSVADLEATYRTAAAHLEPGGVMVALPEELPGRITREHTQVTTRMLDDRRITLIESSYDGDPADHRFETVYVFIIRQGTTVQVEVDRHTNGVFELEEFVAAIERAGFDAVVEPWELSDWEPDIEPLPLITAVLTGKV